MTTATHPTTAELAAALAAAKTGAPETSAESAIAVYQAAQSVIDAYTAVKDQARQLLADIMIETGQTSYNTPAGKASVTAPAISVTYDAKAIDIVCRTNQQIADLLAPYRKETIRPGSLRITAAK